MNCQRCGKPKAKLNRIESEKLFLCFSCVVDINLSLMGLTPRDDDRVKDLLKMRE